jgi:rare lipoprotein A (peptidoglycan hydrolase)
MDLFIRTIGLPRATTKLGLANIVYNIKGWSFFDAARRHNKARVGDLCTKTNIGKASVYSRRFTGRRMAGGAHFHPASDSAASRTLPLGTVAAVTNLETGRTATVRIRDRGPYRTDRILDVSPRTAEELGMGEN